MRSLFVFFSLCFCLSQSALAKRLLVLGDSLTEGYGVAREAAFPALLEKKLQKDDKGWVVINGGVSGSTSASGVARLKWQLKNKPDVVIVALGANDGLRGLAPKDLEKNLSEVVELAQSHQIKVILAGMKMPPNYTKAYVQQFDGVFPRVALKYKVHLIPFLLEGVGGRPALNQPDGIHPNEKGHQIIADLLYRRLKGYL